MDLLTPTALQVFATVVFGLAVLHTFFVKVFEQKAHHYPESSMGRNLFHFLAEIEAIFGIWSAVFFIGYSLIESFKTYDSNGKLIGGAVHFVESLNFTEPIFVTVIMAMAGTRPIILFARKLVFDIADFLPFQDKMNFYLTALILGPLLGSFITEPAAMTVTALVLASVLYKRGMSERFKYATIGLLFVNISIGGTLTHFAAPPVVMVASKWGWDMTYMLTHFGFKSVLAILISTSLFAFIFRKELTGSTDKLEESTDNLLKPEWWKVIVHLLFITIAVLLSHYQYVLLGVFMFFVGFTKITEKYQTPIKLRESLLVGFFLSGLIVLGTLQEWWLRPILTTLSDVPLFFGATFLTAITDNAALTYLGSLVDLSESAKYSLVAGAVTGGGLTIIANAPNPIGYGILKDHFQNGFSPLQLFKWALGPTVITIICFELVGNL